MNKPLVKKRRICIVCRKKRYDYLLIDITHVIKLKPFFSARPIKYKYSCCKTCVNYLPQLQETMINSVEIVQPERTIL